MLRGLRILSQPLQLVVVRIGIGLDLIGILTQLGESLSSEDLALKPSADPILLVHLTSLSLPRLILL